MPSDGYLVANPVPFVRTALVEVDVVAPPEGAVLVSSDADGSAHPVQLISKAPTVLSDERMTPRSSNVCCAASTAVSSSAG